MSEAAGSVNIVLSVNKANFSAAMADAQRQLDAFAGKTKAAGHGTVSSMQAASASIRLMENPLGSNMRAIERFLSQSKLLSGAMKAAFPIVGAVAMVGMLAKMGEEVVKFVESIRKMPEAIRTGFAELNLSAQSANDQLQLTNDTLQNSINKLQGKPENNLAIQFDEAVLAADRFAESLIQDNEKMDQLLSKNHISAWALLIGSQGTAEREGTVKYYGQKEDSASLAYQQAVRNHDDVGAANALADVKKWQGELLGNVLGDRKKRIANPEGPNNDGNINIDTGVATNILTEQNHQAQLLANAGLTAQNKKAEADKAAAATAKRLAAQAVEARKKAATEQLQAWENENSDWKAVTDRSLLQDARWWRAKLAVLNVGSLNYRAVNKKVNADIIAENKRDAVELEQFTKTFNNGGRNKNSGLGDDDEEQLTKSGHKTLEWISALREGADLTEKNARALEEYSLQSDLATGNLSKLDAAQVLANLHSAEYKRKLTVLQDARTGVQENTSLDEGERSSALIRANNAINDLNDQRFLQEQQDHQNTNPRESSGTVGLKDALNDFVASSRDMASEVRNMTREILDSMNEEILKGMSGQRTDFAAAGSTIFRGLAGSMLKFAEGTFLGALGGKSKVDGSRDNPFWMRSADVTGKESPAEQLSSLSSFPKSVIHKVESVLGMSKAKVPSAGTRIMDALPPVPFTTEQNAAGNADNAAAAAAMAKFNEEAAKAEKRVQEAGQVQYLLSVDPSGSSLLKSGIKTIATMLLGGVPKFANGGAVSPGTLALVGEKGPELAYFGSGANITPNHKLSALSGRTGGDTHIHVDATGSTDPAQTQAAVYRGIQLSAPHLLAASQRNTAENNRRTPASRR